MSEAPITYRGTVYPWHCDHMGHMNVMWYVGKFDEATWQFFTGIGLAPSVLRATNRGMVALEQHLHYKRELHAGDVVSVRTAVLEAKDKTIRFVHEMFRDEDAQLAAATVLTGVYLDTVARRSCALPENVRRAAMAWHAGDPSRWA